MQRLLRSPFPTQGLVADDVGMRDVLPELRDDSCRSYVSSRLSQAWAGLQFAGMTLLFGGFTWMLLSLALSGEGGRGFWLTLCLVGLLFCLSELGYSLWWMFHGPYRVLLDPARGTWETNEWRGQMAEIAQVDLEGVQRGLGQFQVKVVIATPDKQQVALGLFPDLRTAESVARHFACLITLRRLAIKGAMRPSKEDE